jgi:hypothetical protein
MLEAIERDNDRRLAELDAVKACKQRRRETVTNSNALIKELKRQRALSKKTLTSLNKDYERAKVVLERLQKEVSKPHSKSRSQSMPAALTITAQQERVDEHASQVELEQGNNAKLDRQVEQIQSILVAIRDANHEDLSLETALDEMDRVLLERADDEVIKGITNDHLAGLAAAALHNNDDDLGFDVASDDISEGSKRMNTANLATSILLGALLMTCGSSRSILRVH